MTALPPDDPGTRAVLRHLLATLAYRAGKAVRATDASFADYLVTPESNSPRTILAHMGDLMDWTLRKLRDGDPGWTTATPRPWDEERARFFAALEALDAHLASDAPLRWDPGLVLQGGLADALTHTGQLALLRRLSGHPMKGENYARADIRAGRVGAEQTPPNPKHEF
ncbi:MAG TPA: hypothetical protein VMH61_03900 [Candidatus Acidoferrales bacterium]|nr:hypothetical protein [Candidatus Acidoferrales bacterium]